MAKARKKIIRHLPPKAAAPAPGGVQRWSVPGVCLVLAAITFAVFGRTLTHGFVDFDDNAYVYENPVVARGLTLRGIIWAFTGIHAFNWHPLTWLSHMVDCQLYGLSPGGHHLTNVCLHAATAIALFLVLRQTTGTLWRSAFVAAVFAIHPLRVESVAWVAERKDVLSGLFFMLTVGAYVSYVRAPRSMVRYGLVVFLFAMGLMCKPMLVTLPVVLLLLDYWPLQRKESARWLVMEKLPLLALSAAVCVTTLLAQRQGIQSAGSFSLPLRLANALTTGMVYLGQMVFPAGLAVFYPHPLNGLPAWQVVLAGVLLVGLSAVAWRQRRKQPWLLVGWLWYLVMLLPVVGIIQAGNQAHADRYTYLPQIGIYVAVTWLAAKWQAGRAAFGSLMAGVVAGLMICAWKQTAYWKNSETLWARALACTTDNDMAHFGMGDVFRNRERWDDAIVQYQKALQIRPKYSEAENNLGFALFKEGRVDEAITQYKSALELKPDYSEACNNLGNALFQKGSVDEAIIQLQKAAQFKPDDAIPQLNLGLVFFKMGRVDEAIAHYQIALQIQPDNAEARYNLGIAFQQKGRAAEAIAQYQTALQIKPGYAEAHNNLGLLLFQQGQIDAAIAHLQKAVELQPDSAEAHSNLGGALFRRGNLHEAISQFQKALQIQPDNANVHNNLGTALLQDGNLDGAITNFQRALEIHPDFADAHYGLGNAFSQKGKTAEAIAHYQMALQLNPANPEAQNNLAWLLATCAETSLRNGSKAVELARQANDLTGGTNPIVLHTLAAALAEAGRFNDAKESVQKAIASARAAGQPGLAEQFNGELKRYEAGLPLRQK